jgi:IS30 family transposase
VAVAATRYGRRSAVITRTGQDPFGEYLHDALRSFGVADRVVAGHSEGDLIVGQANKPYVRSPWQRGSNENTNGLLRPCLPKGTDLRALRG